jgi:two-component system, cell cycle response regulator CpdR
MMARILLADDDSAMRNALEASLIADGHQVVSADNGADAHAILAAGPQKFHVLISDVQMPEMDGFQLAEKALAMSPSLRIVLMSGFADGFKQGEALKPRLAAMLTKPVSREALRAAIAGA